MECTSVATHSLEFKITQKGDDFTTQILATFDTLAINGKCVCQVAYTMFSSSI